MNNTIITLIKMYLNIVHLFALICIAIVAFLFIIETDVKKNIYIYG